MLLRMLGMPHVSCWLEQLVTNLASKAVLLFVAYVFPVALPLSDNHCAWHYDCTCKSCISRKSKAQTKTKQNTSS